MVHPGKQCSKFLKTKCGIVMCILKMGPDAGQLLQCHILRCNLDRESKRLGCQDGSAGLFSAVSASAGDASLS